MKKRLLTVVVLVVLAMAPTFAKSSDMSVGVGLGTMNGVSFKYNLDRKNTLGGTLGVNLFNLQSIDVEVFYLYKATEVKIDKLVFDINAGAGGAVGIPIKGNDLTVSPLVMGEASYSFKGDLPIDLLLRIGVGPKLIINSAGLDFGLAYQASVQGLWRL